MPADPLITELGVDDDVQVLVVTTGREDTALLDVMHVTGNAVLANQCDSTGTETFERPNGAEVVHVRDTSIGVGRNRNNALMHAQRALLLLADDDMVFREDYEAIAHRWFDRLSTASVLVFNLGNSGAARRKALSPVRVTRRSYMNYGAARLGIRLPAVRDHDLRFSTQFGGGAQYSSGEDSIFLRDCLAAGLEIWAVPDEVASLTDVRESTWFSGYDQKYFSDKGALFFELSSIAWPVYVGAFALRRRRMYGAQVSIGRAALWMLRGAIMYGFSRPVAPSSNE